jgi:anti-sigma factor RsiW
VSSHLDPETLEQYALGRTSDEQERAVQEHIAGCKTCSEEFRFVKEYVSVLQAALLSMDFVVAVHRTPDGPVTLAAGKLKTRWAARV